MVPAEADISALLAEMASGNQAAAETVVPLVYQELKHLARRHMRRERPDHTLQTTALVHEAYLKLVRQQDVSWKGRSHFLGVASQLMRRILIDHARAQLREKRGGIQFSLTLDDVKVVSPKRPEELLKLDEALNRLSKLDARQSRVVELRFFGGLSVEETSEVLGLSPKTVKRDWAVAKAWLHAELRNCSGDVTRTMGAR